MGGAIDPGPDPVAATDQDGLTALTLTGDLDLLTVAELGRALALERVAAG